MQMNMDINQINDQSEILSSTLSPFFFFFFFTNPTYLYNLKIEPNSPSDVTLEGPNSLSDITFFKVAV